MSRDVPYDENEKCDICGKEGAFDFMGDFLCENCLESIKEATPCEICGCLGNYSCGKKDNLPDNCALNEELICPCCAKTV